MIRLFAATLLLLYVSPLCAQHLEIGEKALMYKGTEAITKDSTSLLYAFKSGHFNGHFRYFFMSTQNQKGLTDYYANAAGGGLRYESAKFHGFQFAVSGFYTFNIGSSDLGKADSITGQFDRYEIALFDVEDPYNKNDNDRLEELVLKYYYKKSFAAFGKQLINRPFINMQDGRMRPTGVEGFWFEWNGFKKVKIEGGWLYAISPRATTRWFGVGESVGVYPAGVNALGARSQYADNLESKGVFLLGTHLNVGGHIKIQGWDIFTENIFNTAMLQADFSFPLRGNESIFASAQFIRQDAVNNGGHSDPAKSYFEKGGKAVSFGAKAGWKSKQWEASINYNRITADGRYLMPREWGREPFFTYLPRERNEGFGNLHAVMGKVSCNFPALRLKPSVAAGYYSLPGVLDYRLNKYGLPSYTQVNVDVRYDFNKVLNGLDAQLLVVGKMKTGETYNNKKFEFNKVNVVQYNLVLNYHF